MPNDIESGQQYALDLNAIDVVEEDRTYKNRMCYIMKLLAILFCIAIIIVLIIVIGFAIYVAKTDGFAFDKEYNENI